MHVVDFFEDYYYFKHKNIILNSIRVEVFCEDKSFRIIPFDIQVAGEDEFHIKPSVSDGKFAVIYDYMEV